MKTGLSTHRSIQLSTLLENLESKRRICRKGVEKMKSISGCRSPSHGLVGSFLRGSPTNVSRSPSRWRPLWVLTP
jgi:hypothetical protein